MADLFLAALCPTEPLTFIPMPGAPTPAAPGAEVEVVSPTAALQVSASAAQPEAMPPTTIPEISGPEVRPVVSAPAVRSKVSAADPPPCSVTPEVSELEEGEIREEGETATFEQALYASRPQTPVIKLEEPELGGLELREQTQPAASEPVIHHARRQLMESYEPREVQHKVVRKHRAPTGANMDPLGTKIKSESPGRSSGSQFEPLAQVTPRYMTSRAALFDIPERPFPSYMFDQGASSMARARPEGLMYPVGIYLPPAGIYYDELALPNIFEANFLKLGHCGICWRRHPADFFSTTCRKKCKVCGTQRHKDESCPLFYCTAKWYRDRGIPYLPKTLRNRHIRPDEQEQVILREMGVIAEAPGVDGVIVANEGHQLVQAFYKGRASPKAMISRIVDTKRQPAPHSAFITTADGPSFVSNVRAQAPLPPPPARSCNASSSFVNSNRDPRLQCPTSSGKLASPQRIQVEAANAPQHATTTTAIQDSEDRLQEKELEILRLRMETIVKDRETRKLKAENETLKAESERLRGHHANNGTTYETGNKRRRL